MFRRAAVVIILTILHVAIPSTPVTAQSSAAKSNASEADRQGSANGPGQQRRGGGGKSGGSGLGNYTVPPPANNVPEHLYNILLGRPTDSSITVRVLFHKSANVHIEYGLESGKLTQTAPAAKIEEKGTYDFVLKGLKRNSRYYYKLVYTLANAQPQSSDEYSFHTQRDPGSSFVFTVTSDSHLDENTSGEVYLRTLANALNDSPDFHFELGDTFMTGKYVKPEFSEPQYLPSDSTWAVYAIRHRYSLLSAITMASLVAVVHRFGRRKLANAFSQIQNQTNFIRATIKANRKLVCRKTTINGNGVMHSSLCWIHSATPLNAVAMAITGPGLWVRNNIVG